MRKLLNVSKLPPVKLLRMLRCNMQAVVRMVEPAPQDSLLGWLAPRTILTRLLIKTREMYNSSVVGLRVEVAVSLSGESCPRAADLS
jgi:hypothetical protein